MAKFLDHFYGSHVHIFDDLFLNGVLAELCSPQTLQPQINQLVELLYTSMIVEVMNREFPQSDTVVNTRMNAPLKLRRIDPSTKAISVNIARAGTLPSHLCYNCMHYAVRPENLRQDHIFAARVTDSKHKITGTEIGATKIGGPKENAFVVFPDPMGATGHTLIAALNHYKEKVPGQAKKFIALHLIVTPEYLHKVTQAHPDLIVYGLRLDRGLSSEAILKTPPGKNWEQERGLNENGYIVPGGGGFGEIMNNSFV